MDVDFTIGDDVVELASTIADFFTRRDDARAISAGAAAGAAVDAARWAALCDIGLPALRLAEPRGIGASVLDATALAEKIGSVLLPEPASAVIVLARVWDEHDGSSDTLDAMLQGSAVAYFAASKHVGLRTDGTVSGRIRLPDDDLTDLVVVPTDAGLVLLEKSALTARGDHGRVDPTRPTRPYDLDGATPVEVIAVPPQPIRAAADELTILATAELVGGMQTILDETIGYVTARRQFGRSIGSFQAVKHQLADMYVAVEQARAAVQFAAIGVDHRTGAAATDVTAAARWVPRMAVELFDHAIHLHGAMGYSWEVDVHLHLRRALTTRTLLAPGTFGRLAS